MDELIQLLFPDSVVNSGAALLSFVIFIVIAFQLGFNIWSAYNAARHEKKRVQLFRRDLQASEARLKVLFGEMEENRKALLESMKTVSETMENVRQATKTENESFLKITQELNQNSKPSTSKKKPSKKDGDTVNG